jgi:putative flavoprotein involved in K+ transport
MEKKRAHFDVIIIGGGQAGLSVGYHLAKLGLSFVILDASARIGDVWRSRWDSLRLFTPARFDSLDGMPFPGDPDSFPTKDQMADYLEAYAARFELPVLSGVKVDKLSRLDDGYLIRAGAREFEADQVVVAMSNYQKRVVPSFAAAIDPSITQLHSIDYKSPAQLKPGGVLLVGAGNSGSEIAMELAATHKVYMSGRDTGEVPFRIAGFWGRLILTRIVLRFFFHRILTIKTPMGRKARPKMLKGGAPLIRVRSYELAAAGVDRTPRTIGVRGGRPTLEDGRVPDVTNVVWCTGFHSGFSWIDLPIFDDGGDPRHVGGVVGEAPGLFFVGQHFLYSFSSTMIHGVGRDAARIAGIVAARYTAPRSLDQEVRSTRAIGAVA